MVEHLSPLALDEVASDDPVGAHAAHLADCVECRDRLASVRRERVRTKAAVEYERVFARVAEQARPKTASWHRWLRLAAPLALVASALVIFVRAPSEPPFEERLKGSPTVGLVRLPDREPALSFRTGERVALTVGAAGFPFALILAVDESGDVSQAWPSGGDKSGAVPTGAMSVLDPPFEVTPGSSVLVALFSDAPIDGRAALAAARRGVEETRRRGVEALELEVPSLPGERGRARFRVVVKNAPAPNEGAP